MTESGAVLANDKTQCVAVAVQLHTKQLLRGPGGLSLDPERISRAGPVDPAPLAHRRLEALPRAPDQTQGLPLFVAYDGGPESSVDRLDERSAHGFAQAHAVRIEGHPHLSVGPQLIQSSYVLGGGDPARRGDPDGAGRLDGLCDQVFVPARHPSFVLHLGQQEATHKRRQFLDPVDHSVFGFGLPTLHDHLAVFGVDGGDHPIPGQLGAKIHGRGCSDDDVLRSGVQPP